jgi:SanA protein
MRHGSPARAILLVKRSRLLLLLAGAASLTAAGAILFSARRIERSTAPALVPELAALPRKRVGLVLGCAPLLGSGRPNWYFEKRIEAAAAVLAAGKVDYSSSAATTTGSAMTSPPP